MADNALTEALFTDPSNSTGDAERDGDKSYPLGYDTEFGAGRILPDGRDETKGEDYTSFPSGALVGERATETLVGYPTQPGLGPDLVEEAGETAGEESAEGE